jgi:glucan phosphoethanolaminetransferase (alkaline phosphatase superfamily)
MSQLTVWLDLFAGILAGTSFLLPKRWHEKIDNWLQRAMALSPGAKDPGHSKSLWVSIILALAFFVGLTAWGVVVDLGKATLSVRQLAISSSMVIVGAIIGIGILVCIVLARRNLPRFSKLNPILTVMYASIVFGMLSIIQLLWVPHQLFPAIIGLSSGFLIMGLIMEGVPLARQYLTFQGGVLARIGLLLFIASKIIQLKSLTG